MASMRDTVKGLLGTAWHVAHDAFFTALLPATDGTVEANKALVPDANKDLASLRNLTITGALTAATQVISGAETHSGAQTFNSTISHGTVANAADLIAIKGHYMNPAVITVAVPTIANDATENVDSVAVDVSASFTMQPAVGDAVIAIPMEALPTDCLLLGAYVTATDTITLTFGSKEGGGGVTGANKNFNFLVIDLT